MTKVVSTKDIDNQLFPYFIINKILSTPRVMNAEILKKDTWFGRHEIHVVVIIHCLCFGIVATCGLFT